MKIRFDESIANRIARAVMEVVANREGYEVSFIRHGSGEPDPNWITKFAGEAGTAIVSGDHDILQHWPNLIAYTESGLISFFPPKPYEQLGAYGRAAFLIRWWPAIIEKIKISKRGDRWRLPLNWTQNLYLANENALALRSYLDRGRRLRQLSDQALAEKHFEVIKAWAKHLHAGPDVADVYAEYELRGIEPLGLVHMPAWSVIKAAVGQAVQAMSEERGSRIVREIFDVARKVEDEIN